MNASPAKQAISRRPVYRPDMAAKSAIERLAELFDAVGSLAAQRFGERGIAGHVDEEHRAAERRRSQSRRLIAAWLRRSRRAPATKTSRRSMGQDSSGRYESVIPSRSPRER